MQTRFPPATDAQAELIARAAAVIPGGTTNSTYLPAGREFLAERASGAHITDVDGRRFLDVVLGGGPLVLGHGHPRLVEAARRALDAGTQHFVLHRRTVELAERICAAVPSAEMVRFTGSGSEATFHALRLARAVTGRTGIVKFDGGYHGHHDLGVWSFEHSAGSPPHPIAESAGIQPGTRDDIVVLPFNDAAAVEAVLVAEPARFAAVICEPFQRAIPPVPGFLERVREACTRAGTVLIFDEIVTGFRFAPGGAQELYGVVPDLTTLGKALAGGVPLAALAGRRDLMEHLDPRLAASDRSFQCGTFSGNLLGVECAHTALDVLIDEGGIASLREITAAAADALRGAFADAGEPVQITAETGVFQPFFTDRPIVNADDVRAADADQADAFHAFLLDAGVYKIPAKGYLSVVHDDAAVTELVDATRWALGRLSEA